MGNPLLSSQQQYAGTRFTGESPVATSNLERVAGRLLTAEMQHEQQLRATVSEVLARYLRLVTPSTVETSVPAAHAIGGSTSSSTVLPADEGSTSIAASQTLSNNPPVGEDIAKLSKGTRQIRCSECPQVLLSRRNFIKHAEDEHGLVLPIISQHFNSQTEFDTWLGRLREEEGTEFVSKCGRKKLSNGNLLGYLVCIRGGCASIKAGSFRKRSGKSLKTCSAYLKVIQSGDTGKISIEGCLAHTGHNGTIHGNSVAEVLRSRAANAETITHGTVEKKASSSDMGETAFRLSSPRNLPTMVVENAGKGSTSSVGLTHEQLVNQEAASPIDSSSTMKRKRAQEELGDIEILSYPSAFSEPKSTMEARRGEAEKIPGHFIREHANAVLESRKLAMYEKLQVALRPVDLQTIDAAEVATAFFVREMESLSSRNGLHRRA